ncbi:MAG: type I-E CRISPR-associated protein Cse1/CasA [Rhodocyclaceae bacterium]|nr:type I-E CRISPR-associated protein Cse1/CasA [Rhodocyclaceae bacterium]
MNLVFDPWLTVRWRDGGVRTVRPAEIADPEALDLVAPRADFRGALFQFLLGLLQTAFPAEDEDEWLERWETPPSVEYLEKAFSAWAPYFFLQADGPAFLQDTKPGADFAAKDVRELLMDLGSVSNLHFNKPDGIKGLCSVCSATALYTIQANAPSGGSGHRVSMRGGGPLTSLLVPQADKGQAATLWQRLWLNVLSQEIMRQPGGRFDGQAAKDILPWLVATRSSEKKDGQTTPDHAHALQAYWGMPRRIRLDWENTVAGRCDLCGKTSETLLSRYRTRKHGVSYLGWQHPLTPYYHDPNKEDPPSAVKGQSGGISYRHWLGLTLGSNDKQPEAALVVRHFLKERWGKLGKDFRALVWAFGYQVDKGGMKALSWSDSTLPTYHVAPTQQEALALEVGRLLEVAQEAAKLLHRAVKSAWADRPGDLKDEPAIGQSFWSGTEPLFYGALEALTQTTGLEGPALLATQRQWLTGIRKTSLDLFDDWVTGEYEKDWDIERTVKARVELEKWLSRAKPMNALWKSIKQQEASV